MNCSRGDVVLLPSPFSDLTSRKVRPAVVIGRGSRSAARSTSASFGLMVLVSGRDYRPRGGRSTSPARPSSSRESPSSPATGKDVIQDRLAAVTLLSKIRAAWVEKGLIQGERESLLDHPVEAAGNGARVRVA